MGTVLVFFYQAAPFEKENSKTPLRQILCTLFSKFGPLWSMSIIWVPSLFYWFCECFEDTFLLSIDWMMVLVTDTGSPFGAKILRWSSGLLNSYTGRKILLSYFNHFPLVIKYIKYANQLFPRHNYIAEHTYNFSKDIHECI